MEDSRVALHPAKPEFEEGLLFARYPDAAADGVFRFMLEKAADRVLAKAYLEPAHAPEGDLYLQVVAVDAQSRGGGVGSALIRHAEERGRGAGCTRIALDVAVDNHGAQQLYARLGFVVEAMSPRSAILPEGQVRRMAAML